MIAGALLICAGAFICAWSFMTTGDQTAVACVGGGLIGLGVAAFGAEVAS